MNSNAPWLLVSDIDDTLTGDREALKYLWRILRTGASGLKLALNSSRPKPSVDRTLKEFFPDDFEPDAIITGLGTQISTRSGKLASWEQQFETWPDQAIRDRIASMGFRPHDDIFQTSGKVSFAVPGTANVDRVLRRLEGDGVPFRYIHSGESDLDILAPGAGKDAAMRHLADHLGIAMTRTVAAGDSANDLALFQAAGKAIAVGNARQELVSEMPMEKTYHAKAAHAAGVLEGLIAHGLVSPLAPDSQGA